MMAVMSDDAEDSTEVAKDGRGRALAFERRAHISRELQAVGSVQVASIAAELGVSDMTVRRDLIEMERDDRLTRVRGGAVSSRPHQSIQMAGEEPSFQARLRREASAKVKIAAAAAEMVTGCRTLALDVGTSTYTLAQRLTELQHLRIFTNSLRIATLLSDGRPEVYVAGGRVRADEHAVVGPVAVGEFEHLWFDVAVVGVSGLTAEGFFDYAYDEVDVKRVFLRRSERKIILCDASKFHRLSLIKVGPLDAATVLVTNAEPPADLMSALAAAHVHVHVAA